MASSSSSSTPLPLADPKADTTSPDSNEETKDSEKAKPATKPEQDTAVKKLNKLLSDANISDLVPVTTVLLSLSINSLLDAAYGTNTDNCSGFAQLEIRTTVFILLFLHCLLFSGWKKRKSLQELGEDIEKDSVIKEKIEKATADTILDARYSYNVLLAKKSKHDLATVFLVVAFNLSSAAIWLFSTTNIYLVCFISGGKSVLPENLKVLQIMSGIMILFLSGILTALSTAIKNAAGCFCMAEVNKVIAGDDGKSFVEEMEANRVRRKGNLLELKEDELHVPRPVPVPSSSCCGVWSCCLKTTTPPPPRTTVTGTQTTNPINSGDIEIPAV